MQYVIYVEVGHNMFCWLVKVLGMHFNEPVQYIQMNTVNDITCAL